MVGRATVGFRISGTVTGLYPGGTRPLVLTVTNRESVAITVTALSTIVTAASTLCLGANVKVTSFTGSLPVAAGGQATTTVQAKMVHAAPVACEGVTFPFVYRGQAVAP